MSDLVAFLTARLDEDEATANEVHLPRSCGCIDRDGEFDPDPVYCGCDYPARVLREVEAKRKILARYEFARNQVAVGEVNEAAGYGPADKGWPLRADSHSLDVRDLAAVYSDHPDYPEDETDAQA